MYYNTGDTDNVLLFDLNTGESRITGRTINNPLEPGSRLILRHPNGEILLFNKKNKTIEIYDAENNTSNIIRNPVRLDVISDTIMLPDGNIISIGGYSYWTGYAGDIILYKLNKND